MEPTQDLLETLPPDSKWRALLDTPAQLDARWRVWLAGAQRAEQEALLTYWARRSNAGASRN